MRYYGQFRPPVDKIIHTRYFPDKTFGLAMESGAGNGKRMCSTKFFEETMHWKCINIEPHPRSFKSLVEKRPASLNIQAAMSDKTGVALFKYLNTKSLRMTDSLASEDEVLNPSKRDSSHIYVEVPVVTFSSIIKKYNIKHLDLFVLDVEGYELKVLSDLIICPVKPEVLVVEHKHVGKYNIKDIINNYYEFDYKKMLNSYYIRRDVSDKYRITPSRKQ